MEIVVNEKYDGQDWTGSEIIPVLKETLISFGVYASTEK